ncbi:MAG TPA: hypothetical protein VGI61_06205 [Parafilimonas sp.]|jgi:hypothetical protein
MDYETIEENLLGKSQTIIANELQILHAESSRILLNKKPSVSHAAINQSKD